ncbi:hypothetical protein BD311DRAFT_659517 [Dichomitus squalens]|uniref:AB hydrolase-1 domain-containing protein n=1 Tax=Dichomitus squalens TaxID=114155 RepID=A0A4Q9MR85_9APHY|nr:hypothetical protein BD311DRAFT_659517 [Dichomitus squalens]
MTSASGLHILSDSRAPGGSTDYTTLVLLHGNTIHGGTFVRLLPHAATHNARIVLVNRRDYPGATPYAPEERILLEGWSLRKYDVQTVKDNMALFMRHRAEELLTLLEELVRDGSVTRVSSSRTSGGIVVAGWSLGIVWMSALLAHISSSPRAAQLKPYLRRVVMYDPGSFMFNYPRPDDPYEPFLEPEAQESSADLLDWVSGYFAHGATVDALERREPMRYPLSSLRNVTLEDLEKMICATPGQIGGTDQMLVVGGHNSGFFGELWKRALELSPTENLNESANANDGWRGLGLHIVWCDRSVWECVHGVWGVQAEVAEAREKGRAVRDVTFTRIEGGNHFAHWDYPKETLAAMLRNDERLAVGVLG